MHSQVNEVEEKTTSVSSNIYDILVDFEKEQELEKELEELESQMELESGHEKKQEMDLEKYKAEKHKLKLEILEMEKQIKKMQDDAIQEAEKIKAEAFESASREGYSSGYENGYSVGYQDAENEVNQTLKIEAEDLLLELKTLIESVEQSKRDILEEYKDDLKDIAIAIAEKIIHVSLKSSGDIIKRMIVSATEGILSKEWVKIYIAKCDAELAVNGDSDLIGSLSYVSDRIKIILMEDEASGTCIIELPDKVIDASANTQIENIKDIISSSRM